MANKRVNKILRLKSISGLVKLANDSDPVDFVTIECPKCFSNSIIYKEKDYVGLIQGRYDVPEVCIHNLTIRDRRNRQNVLNKLTTNKYVSIMYKKNARKSSMSELSL